MVGSRRHVGRYAVAVALVSAAAVPAAHAATVVTTTNACLYSVEGEYRDQAVTLTGTGSPTGAAAGAVATLSGASLSARLPVCLPQTGYELGIFRSGYNAIASKVWVALAATNAPPGSRADRHRLDDDPGARRRRVRLRDADRRDDSRSRGRRGRSSPTDR